MKEGIYAEAQQQFEAALKLNSFELVGLLQPWVAIYSNSVTGSKRSTISRRP